MDKNLNNQPPIENDVVSQIENQFEQQQTMQQQTMQPQMQPQMNANLQQQYMSMQVPNTNVKKKGIGLGIFSLIVSIITFICGLIPGIGLFIEIPGAIIVLILGIIALIKNRMLGKILAIIALLIILGSIILDFFII